MKKIVIGIAILLLLAIAFIYLFIPGEHTIAKSVTVMANNDALYRKLGNEGSWKEWWPGKQEKDSLYELNDIRFKIAPLKVLSVPLTIEMPDFKTNAELTFIPSGTDSTTLHIETTIPSSNNPLKKVRTYFSLQKLERNLSDILQSIKNTYSKTVNLYGYDIQKKLVVDSILVFTSEEVKGYPTINKIYSLIDELKDYIKKNDAAETGFPMQNIYTADSINYLVKVAIPVNKKLPDSKKIHYRWMLGGGNILITEVNGGPYQISQAYKQILSYISDYKRTAPAIPFESLVTDRRNEPDTSKWVTWIYYPVM